MVANREFDCKVDILGILGDTVDMNWVGQIGGQRTISKIPRVLKGLGFVLGIEGPLGSELDCKRIGWVIVIIDGGRNDLVGSGYLWASTIVGRASRSQ